MLQIFKQGHLADNCSEAARTGICSLLVIQNFSQNQIQQIYPINNNWVLLGTCSLASVLKNAYLAKNVRNCNSDDKLLMLTNSRHLSFNQMGDLLLLPMKFHINKSIMENILYFAEVYGIAGVHIKMDMSKEKIINVHIEYGKIVHFRACAEGFSAPTLMTPT